MANPEQLSYIGVDIGGTHARVGVSTDLGSGKFDDRRKLTVANDYAADSRAITEAIVELSGDAVAGIGIGSAGKVNADRTALEIIPNLPDWNNQPLVRDLRQRFKCDVFLANDAEAAALAEATYGSGRTSSEPFWFVIWGTGVGGAFVSYHDTHPTVHPGEFGHVSMDPNAPAGPEGTPGTLESFIGGKALEQRYGKTAAELSETEWQEVEDLAARGLAALATTLLVEKIVLSGGVISKQRQRLPRIQELLQQRQTVGSTPVLQLAEHEEDAGLLGALALSKM